MNEDRALALARRQGQLLERSARLRDEVACCSRPVQRTLAQVDATRAQLQGGWLWLRENPQVPLAAAGALVALLLVLRPRRVLGGAARLAWRWGRRGLLAWRLWQRYGAKVQGQPAAGPAAGPLQQALLHALLRWARRFTTPR